MRTTLNIDDEALAAAMRHAGDRTKTAVINEALREFARRREVAELLTLRGKVKWDGNVDDLRKRAGQRR
jgi:Arc/MetJ family transcription regulator